MAKAQSGKTAAKKRVVKVEPHGDAHINAAFNNVIISLTNKSGQVISWSSAGKMGGIPMLITCERNGIGTLNSSLAFGNGATLQDGLTFPFSGKLIAATMTCSSLTGTVTVRAYKNSIAQNAFSLTASSSGATVSAIQNWQSAPLSFSSGDLFVFKQIAVPTSADCFVVVFFIVFD